MSVIQSLVKELEREAVTTRKMLERVPEDKYSWQPHARSMTLLQLSMHVAEIPGWIPLLLSSAEWDFATHDFSPRPIKDHAALLAFFESTFAEAREKLSQAADTQLGESYTLRHGDHVIEVSPKSDVLRMMYNQVVHHRAQLGVYLRLLDIPIPGSYGPSADEN